MLRNIKLFFVLAAAAALSYCAPPVFAQVGPGGGGGGGNYNPAAVAITGGSINATTIGSSTPTSIVSSTLTANSTATFNANAQIASGRFLQWNSDVFLARDAANALAQRNDVNPQEFRVYNNYTDASNNEYGGLKWSSNLLIVGTQPANGTGTSRSIKLNAEGGTITLQTFSADRFIITAAAIRPSVNNGADLGTGSFKFQNTYSSVFWTNTPTNVTSAYTVGATDANIITNGSASITLTLPAASQTGRMMRIRNIAAFAVVSASANIVPLTGGAAGTAILPATAGKWVDLLADGTNWQTMAGN